MKYPSEKVLNNGLGNNQPRVVGLRMMQSDRLNGILEPLPLFNGFVILHTLDYFLEGKQKTLNNVIYNLKKKNSTHCFFFFLLLIKGTSGKPQYVFCT